MKSNYYLLTNLMNEKDQCIINSIVAHIENDSGKVGIQQIADENYVSTAFIMKLCKKLGFRGYSELFYNLAKRNGKLSNESHPNSLQSLIDNYDEEKVQAFCTILHEFCEQKMFAVGAGFANLVADYIVQRLAICGFMVFNQVHFYDVMLFRQDKNGRMATNIEPSIIFAISQSGESEVIINNVEQAREKGFKVVSFCRRADSTLAKLSDICFIVDASDQTLIGEVPNPFFGQVILVFEELMGIYFG